MSSRGKEGRGRKKGKKYNLSAFRMFEISVIKHVNSGRQYGKGDTGKAKKDKM